MPEVSTVISPNDRMYAGDVQHYFSVGKSGLRVIRIALEIAGASEPKTILDLPCGHGRVLRHLVAAFPGASVTACDLDCDAVDFCAREFGVRGVYSSKSVGEIRTYDRFDLIWCGSLLTHLPEPQSLRFLMWFEDRLSPDGVLIVTLHGRCAYNRQTNLGFEYINDERFATIRDGYILGGYGYADYHDGAEYGISISLPSWAVRWAESRPRLRLLGYSERLWDDHHDVLMLQRVGPLPSG